MSEVQCKRVTASPNCSLDTKCAQLLPGTDGHNMVLKVVDRTVVSDYTYPSGTKAAVAVATVGDETACISMITKKGITFDWCSLTNRKCGYGATWLNIRNQKRHHRHVQRSYATGS